MATRDGSQPKYGPKPRYGPRNPCTVYWPTDHRERYEREASARGLSLNEYLIRVVARAHDLPVPDDDRSQEELPMGA